MMGEEVRVKNNPSSFSFSRLVFNRDFPDSVGVPECGCSARHHLSNLLFASHEIRDYPLPCNDISF